MKYSRQQQHYIGALIHIIKCIPKTRQTDTHTHRSNIIHMVGTRIAFVFIRFNKIPSRSRCIIRTCVRCALWINMYFENKQEENAYFVSLLNAFTTAIVQNTRNGYGSYINLLAFRFSCFSGSVWVSACLCSERAKRASSSPPPSSSLLSDIQHEPAQHMYEMHWLKL